MEYVIKIFFNSVNIPPIYVESEVFSQDFIS